MTTRKFNTEKIVQENNDLNKKIDRQKIETLPWKIKDKINSPIINLYDSGWIGILPLNPNMGTPTTSFVAPVYHSDSDQYSPLRLVVSKTISSINLPDWLLPFIKVSMIVDPIPNSEAVGIMEFTAEEKVDWGKFYCDGELVYAGKMVDTDDIVYSYELEYANIMNSDDENYTTIRYGIPLYVVDVYYSSGGEKYKLKNAIVKHIYSPKYDISNNGNDYSVLSRSMNDVDSRHPLCIGNLPQSGSDYYLPHPINFQGYEILGLSNTYTTLRGTEYRIINADVIPLQTPYYNVTKRFSLSDCLTVVEADKKEQLIDDVWTYIESEPSSYYFTNSAIDWNPYGHFTITPTTYQMSKLYIKKTLYLPSNNSRKSTIIGKEPDGGPTVYTLTTTKDETFYRHSVSSNVYYYYNEAGVYNKDLCQVNTDFDSDRPAGNYWYPRTIRWKKNPEPYPKLYPRKICYHGINNSNFMTAGFLKKCIYRRISSFNDVYDIDIDANIILKCLDKKITLSANEQDNTYTANITLSTVSGYLRSSYNNINRTIDAYSPPKEDCLIKFRVDIVNPFYNKKEPVIKNV